MLCGATASFAGDAQPKTPAYQELAGDDLGAALSRCVQQAPKTGGICDGRRFAGALTVNAPLLLDKPNLRVLLPPGEIRIAPAASLSIVADGVALEGVSAAATKLVAGGTGLRIGTHDVISRRWAVSRLTVQGTPGAAGAAGLSMENAREGRLSELVIWNFKGDRQSGVHVGPNCWAVLLDDVYLTANRVGLWLNGGNLNAWTLRGGYVNLNGVGILFDFAGSGHGIFIGDGILLENNVESAVSFRSGRYWDVRIADFYGEVPAKGKLVDVADGAAAELSIAGLTVENGYFQAETEDVIKVAANRAPVRMRVRDLVVQLRFPVKRLGLFEGSRVSAAVSGMDVSGPQAPGAGAFAAAKSARLEQDSSRP